MLSYIFPSFSCQDQIIFSSRSISPILELIELLFYREKMLQSCTETLPLPNLVPIQFHDVEGNFSRTVVLLHIFPFINGKDETFRQIFNSKHNGLFPKRYIFSLK